MSREAEMGMAGKTGDYGSSSSSSNVGRGGNDVVLENNILLLEQDFLETQK